MTQVALEKPRHAAVSQMPRRRILISAFAVSPARGSEPGVGWHIPSRLAAWHDVTVLCVPGIPGEPYREEIESYLQTHRPLPGLHFEYVPHTRLSGMLQQEKFNGSCFRGLYYMGYKAWQRAALARAQQLHRAAPFDLVHHLTITTYREPGYLWRMGLPFVWGPLTGAANVPLAYCHTLSWHDRVFQTARTLCNCWQMRTNWRCRRAAGVARRIWVVSEDDRRMVSTIWGQPCELMPEVGTILQPLARVRQYDGARPLQLVWSGLHIGRKALPLLLHALCRLQRPGRWKLTVLGTGPQTDSWKAMGVQLGIASHIYWTGRLSQEQAVEQVAAADVLVHTSLQEATATVVLEAMSLGVPVICHDACGMALAVTQQCGVKITMGGPEASIEGFAQAMRGLLDHPRQVSVLSAGALQRAEEMTWDARARYIGRVYDEILAARQCPGRGG